MICHKLTLTYNTAYANIADMKSHQVEPKFHIVHDINVRRPLQGNKSVNKVLKRFEQSSVDLGLEGMRVYTPDTLGSTTLQAYRLDQILKEATLDPGISTYRLGAELEEALEYSVGHNPRNVLEVGVAGMMRVGRNNRGTAIRLESDELRAEQVAMVDYLMDRFGVPEAARLDVSVPHLTLSVGEPARRQQWPTDLLQEVEDSLPDTLALGGSKTVHGHTQRSSR